MSDAMLSAMLFVPGDDERKLAKVAILPAPAFILDLEDAVAVSAKARARENVARTLRASSAKQRIWVRVNSADTGLLPADLDAVVVPGLEGIVLPKAQRAEDVSDLAAAVAERESARGLQPGSTGLAATIETALGLSGLAGIARASDRLRFLCFGAGDFSLDLGLNWTPDSGVANPTLVAAKTRLVIESRAAGLPPPHDGTFPYLDRPAELRAEALYARSLGFGGKHAIHPDQVPVILEAFRPTEDEVARAREQLLAFEASERAGTARINVGGKFIDYPVAERARQVIAAAETWARS
jgi:citrate lyase subunit beta / citryl-CoA lyase